MGKKLEGDSMENNRNTRVVLLIAVIIIVAIVVLPIAFFFITFNRVANIIETTSSTYSQTQTTSGEGGLSFSELMDLLYIKGRTKGNDTKPDYNTVFYPFDDTETAEYNNSGYIISNADGSSDVEQRTIFVTSNEITIEDSSGNILEKGKIDGIDGEVVSKKINIIEGELVGVAFLTREGYVYFLTRESIDHEKFTAKKLQRFSNIIKIDIATATSDDATGASEVIMTIGYDGTYDAIDFSDMGE